MALLAYRDCMANGAERYVSLIKATLEAALLERKGQSDSMGVALSFAASAVGLPSAQATSPLPTRFVDGAGHSRPLYRGLALYAMNEVGELRTDHLQGLWSVCESDFLAFLRSAKAPTAAEGSRVMGMAFDALALARAQGLEPARTAAMEVLGQIATRQQPDGRFLDRTASDNPEPMWYHELALLHAVTTFAYRTSNRAAMDAALRAAAYQAAQIQPDHASSHPFAMHAFLRTSDGLHLADMMLHAAGVQSPNTMDNVSLLLLADALDCMHRSKWTE